MCGFAGFFSNREVAGEENRNVILNRMGDAISHRGPDDSGIWNNPEKTLGIVHRRLSIIDLSDAGKQPMESVSGRFIIAFNGEIYNHQLLRKQIQQTQFSENNWRGYSDTEVLLICIELWGLEKTLQKIVGMFAFVLLDKKEGELYLVRDRIGEKPIYYGFQKNTFLFGSELKAIKEHPDFQNIIDRNSITLQLRYSCIPAPYSIYKGIRKLLPGTFIRISVANEKQSLNNLPKPIPYWSLKDVVVAGRENPFLGSDIEAVDTLDNLLNQSIQQQMVADVPVGAFLSGGIDSTSVVAIMQAQSSRPIQTFTIGSDVQNYNEAIHAKSIAKYLGTDHSELYVSSQDALNVIPYLPTLYDEPFSDFSQIPTFLISKLASKKVTVSLSGDAGDELFGGYNRYIGTSQWWERINKIPYWLRVFLSSSILSISPKKWDSFEKVATKIIPRQLSSGGFGNNLQKIGSVLSVKDSKSLHHHFVSNWSFPEEVVINGIEPILPAINTEFYLDNVVSQMMAIDTLNYLPDDILVKLDRAAMSVSLETRIPFLDHRVLEFAWTLPLSMKVRSGQGKWVLRQVLNKYVPNKLVDKPKMGFSLPVDNWLRGPLKDWAEDLLDEKRLIREGYFHPAPIRQKWLEHKSGKHNWQHHLWDVLIFQSWLQEQSTL